MKYFCNKVIALSVQSGYLNPQYIYEDIYQKKQMFFCYKTFFDLTIHNAVPKFFKLTNF